MAASVPADPWSLVTGLAGSGNRLAGPVDTPPVRTEAADAARVAILAGAGASRRRDAVDLKVVAGVADATGRLIDNEADDGGWPQLRSLAPELDTDRDGLPDIWERRNGLEPARADSSDVVDKHGWTNLKLYLDWLTKN
ncbi:hypothetical protein GCM10011529_00020 [Polymorphobacter glacialis]|uniref:Pectate lyase n=1 Tax=Sandarakinorhabdus glacialis TaxID=1614636 RepID=A0A917E315_9SPHN|nr:hypothetical protein [Polymorphobacter glacialis]GGD98009.1 hypothetical protein GCM10011529_00020 [Polymorphobacter glacialis]